MKRLNLPRLDGYLPQGMEREYRLYYLKNDVRTATISMVILTILLVAFAYNDYALFGLTPTFYYLIAIRSIYLVFTIGLIVFLRKNRSPVKFDWNLLVWFILSGLLVSAINLTRPSSYIGDIPIDVVLILIIYMGVPMRLMFRTAGGLLLLLAESLNLLLLHHAALGTTIYASLVALLMANIIGIYASGRLYSFRRSEFKARAEESWTLDLLNETGKMASVGGWEFDVKTRLLTWTDEIYRIYELDPGQRITVDDAIKFYAAEAVPVVTEAVQHAVIFGEPFDLELPFITARGNRRWVRSVGRAYTENGLITRVGGTVQDITAAKKAEDSIKITSEQWQATFDAISDLISIQDKDFKLIRVNKAYADAFQVRPEELIGRHCYEIVHMSSVPIPNCPHEKAMACKSGVIEELFEPRLGMYMEVSCSPIFNDNGIIEGTVHIVKNITERKKTEEQKDLYLKIMDLLTKTDEQSELIRKILLLIKDFSGCEAVGIRLREGDDYPYYETNGFMPGHVELENRLCAYDDSGNVVRDSRGNPLLECMCGNIILGRFDPKLPFFTPGGSFCTNCTTELLATTTEEDRQAHTRNRCNGEGYQSVALIPLKGEAGNVGLLQLNDTRRNHFTAELISFYEGVAQSIGIVLARKNAEEALDESEEQLRKLMENAPDGIYMNDLEGNFLYGNLRCEEIIGYKREELIGKNFLELNILPENSLAKAAEILQDNINGKSTGPDELELIRKDGRLVPVEINTSVLQRRGHAIVIAFTRDITERKKIEEERQKAAERIRDLYNNAPAGYHSLDKDGTFVGVNDTELAWLGYERDELIGKKKFFDLLTAESREVFQREFPGFKERGWVKDLEFDLVRKDGTTFPTLVNATAIKDEQGNFLMSRTTLFDITEVKRLQKIVTESEKRFRTILEEINDSYFELDLAGNFTFVNNALCKVLLVTREEIVGANFRSVTSVDEINDVLAGFVRVYATGEPHKGLAFKLARKDGVIEFAEISISPQKDDHGKVVGFRCVGRDITERMELQNKLAVLAMHDALTGLPNRSLLYDRFNIACAQAHRNNRKLAVMELDLDHFKTINDSLGHAAGDELLKATADRLTALVRKSDTVARLGGDEFVVLIPEFTNVKDVLKTAQKILTAFQKPFIIEGQELQVTTSIGIAIYPRDGSSIEELLKAADAATYYTKEHGRNSYKLSGDKARDLTIPRRKTLNLKT